MADLDSINMSFYVIFTMNIIIVLINWLFNIMRAGDQKLMIKLEWPYSNYGPNYSHNFEIKNE